MKLAFCLYKHFPYSGLSRDMLRIIYECRRRGHEVHVFAREWQGEQPDGVQVHVTPTHGLTNHTSAAAFHRRLRNELSKQSFDAVVGFNKMPGLDVYYAADDCYLDRAARLRSPLYRLTPRYQYLASFEASVFSTSSNTAIMLIADQEKDAFQEYYCTPNSRFHLLPPTLDSDRRITDYPSSKRERLRKSLGIAQDELVLLLVGSGFKTKGLDRAIRGLAALPREILNKTYLFVVGQDKRSPFVRFARRLNVAKRVHFLGGRQDVPELLHAGDLLVHPAYNEAAGTILLEAITSGLPVLTTDICGYAPHIQQADAGVVLASPFRQDCFNESLSRMLTSPERTSWQANGIAYGSHTELYSMPHKATEIIEFYGRQPKATRQFSLPDVSTNAMYLRDDIKVAFANTDRFEEIVSVKGDLYRKAPGRRTLRFERNGRAYFLKVHTGVGWREIVKNLSYFRLPVLGAMNEWHGIHRLQRLNIDTLSIAGYGTLGGNPARQRSFIITDELSSMVSLEDYCRRWDENSSLKKDEVTFKRWLIQKLAEISRSIHTNGANHRDYYLCHFLLDSENKQSSTPESSHVYLIDLHRMQLRRRTPTRWMVKDIAGLFYSSMDIGLTKRDLLRFMKVYRDRPLRDILAQETRFWRRVRSRALNLYSAEGRKAQQQQAQEARAAMNTSFGN